VCTPGTYTLTVTGSNGCTSTATAEVDQDNDAPGASAEGGELTCSTTSVMLVGGGNGSYNWTGPNFTSILQNPTVTAPGMYILTVTGANGCTSTAVAFVGSNTDAPEASALGGALPCDGTGLVLDGFVGSEGASFAWSGPDGFTSADLDPVAFVAGTYTFVVTGLNGCDTTITVEVTTQECDKCDTPLILACAPDTTVQCGTNLDQFHLGFPITRKDKDCPMVNYYTFLDVYSGDCPYTLTRTWIIADEAGDTATCVQTVTIIDTIAPVLMAVPADITVSCGQLPAAYPGVWAEDGCKKDELEVTVVDVLKDQTACGYVIERTWSAYDDCGNLGTAIQVITVVDDVPPVMVNVPDDATVECDAVPAPAEVNAWDDCSDVGQVSFEEEIVIGKGGAKCTYSIVRTWTVSDACGNTAMAQQVITVEDTQAPVFECEGYDIKVACGEVPDLEECKVKDNCDGDLDVAFNETSSTQLNGNVLHVRTWTATDDCGNTAVLEQRILEACAKFQTATVDRTLRAAPNPFAAETRITFGSEVEDEVVLDVLAPDGRLITQLYRGLLTAGEMRTITFTDNDRSFGTYLVRMTGRDNVSHLWITVTR
jgi:hypothetical protein